MRLLVLLLALLVCTTNAARSFQITNDQFMRDGQPFIIRSASIHYSRVHPDYWRDRLQRLAALGVNAIQTYVPWNFHEEEQGQFDFAGWRNVSAFLQTAQDVGLIVLLRAGPYMCGEWEFGGFPAWLLAQQPAITIRTYEPGYISYVEKYWGRLLPQVKPLLYSNGGPVVMLQIENEYGSYGDVESNPQDKQYMQHLASLARQHLGTDVLLYTTDGGSTSYLVRGALKGEVYAAVDFGPGDPTSAFADQKAFNAPGNSPKFCSEFYTGWLTHWGESMANTSGASVAEWLDKLLSVGGSVSLYMGHGGSNFGWWSGANGGGTSFQPHITSYDYDSPISEGGEHGYGPDGDKFAKIATVFAKHGGSLPAEPVLLPRTAYGSLSLSSSIGFFGTGGALSVLSPSPISVPSIGGNTSMEKLGQNYGFQFFQATIRFPGNGTLTFPQLADRVQVFMDNKLIGHDYRPEAQGVPVTATPGSTLGLLVENMGRLNFGGGMTDPKGLIGGVRFNNQSIEQFATTSWKVSRLPLDGNDVAKLPFSSGSSSDAPAFYSGVLTIPTDPMDTFISTAGWTKGIVWVNGFMLGRHWEARGPQHTLFVPAPILKTGNNLVVVLELDKLPADPSVTFVSAPDFHSGGPADCQLDPTAKAGDRASMFTCKATGTPLAGAQEWVWQKNNVVVKNTNGCLTRGNDTDPESGSPAVRVFPCGGVPASEQQFTLKANGEIVHDASGNCLDITSHETKEAARVELYACNGGQNQLWSIDAKTGQIKSTQDQHCLSACTPASARWWKK